MINDPNALGEITQQHSSHFQISVGMAMLVFIIVMTALAYGVVVLSHPF